ncbi:MAG: hypothetical protein KDE53_37670, partial [Caldilineaceae bacterium]|nr:hypothetical protein [Caldilineaceae bacterium]
LEQLRAQRLEIQSRDLSATKQALARADYVLTVDMHQQRIFLSDERAVHAPDEVARLLVNAGTPPMRLAVIQQNLEEHFLQLTGASG